MRRPLTSGSESTPPPRRPVADAAAGGALRWAVQLLERVGPFQAVGGLAARAHGARRPLVDLDFYMLDESLPAVARAAGAWVTAPPRRLTGEHWDVTVLTLGYEGIGIEIGGANAARYRDSVTGAWHAAEVDFSRSERIAVLDVEVPVLPRAALVAYKERLLREVDLLDLHDLTGWGGQVDTLLAVYGSLAPGERNHGQVAGLPGSWRDGIVHGTRHPVGWGANYGFPALVWHPDDPPVPVKLFESPELPAHWARLDRFEGDGYRRTVVPVRLADGAYVLAYAYVLRA